jgi:polyribonucleotide nucleotidyltransferase
MAVEMETGRLATLANGAVRVRAGDTMVLVTAVNQASDEKHLEDAFIPLNVEYREKGAAVGRIPTTYHRKETLTDREVLISRAIDRAIRPLFLQGYRDETQIIATVLAADRRYDPDILSINGASLALGLSDIPWKGPIGAVRIGFINNEFVSGLSHTQVRK